MGCLLAPSTRLTSLRAVPPSISANHLGGISFGQNTAAASPPEKPVPAKRPRFRWLRRIREPPESRGPRAQFRCLPGSHGKAIPRKDRSIHAYSTPRPSKRSQPACSRFLLMPRQPVHEFRVVRRSPPASLSDARRAWGFGISPFRNITSRPAAEPRSERRPTNSRPSAIPCSLSPSPNLATSSSPVTAAAPGSAHPAC